MLISFEDAMSMSGRDPVDEYEVMHLVTTNITDGKLGEPTGRYTTFKILENGDHILHDKERNFYIIKPDNRCK